MPSVAMRTPRVLALAAVLVLALVTTAASALTVELTAVYFWGQTGVKLLSGGPGLWSHKTVSYEGPCNGYVTYQGLFRVHNTTPQSANIQFYYVRGDGHKGPVKTLTVPAAGTPVGQAPTGWYVMGPTTFRYNPGVGSSPVAEKMGFNKPVNGWVEVRIVSPVPPMPVKSYRATYNICKHRFKKIVPGKLYPKPKITAPPVRKFRLKRRVQ